MTPSAAGRLALCAILLSCATGCLRNLQAEEAYLDTLRADFERHAFEISLPEAKMRILAMAQSGPSTACAPCVVTDTCGKKSCRFRFGSSLSDEACLVATEEPYGQVSFKVTCGDPWRVETTIRQVWEELDAATLERAETRAQTALAAITLAEARSFSPRWGLTGGAYGVYGSASAGVGARFGVRRWHDPNFLSGLLIDYERLWFETPPAPIGASSNGHVVSLLVRAEVAPWSGFSAHTSLPDASLYMIAGGGPHLDRDSRPGFGWTGRVGVGAHANRYTRSYSLPVFAEAHLARSFFERFSATNVRMTVGVGF